MDHIDQFTLKIAENESHIPIIVKKIFIYSAFELKVIKTLV